ncbi:hypothetical protein CEE69_30230, partial [Rhodopirellula bahusiensis]
EFPDQNSKLKNDKIQPSVSQDERDLWVKTRAMPLAMLKKAVGHQRIKRNFKAHASDCDWLSWPTLTGKSTHPPCAETSLRRVK